MIRCRARRAALQALPARNPVSGQQLRLRGAYQAASLAPRIAAARTQEIHRATHPAEQARQDQRKQDAAALMATLEAEGEEEDGQGETE